MSSLLAFLVAASAPAEATVPRVLILDVAHSEDVRADEAKTIGELLTASVADLAKVEVLSHGDIRALAGLAADQQDAGCDTSGCLAELAGAMDADYVVSCRVSRLGDLVVANLALFDARAAKAGKRVTRKSESVGGVASQIAPAVRELFADTNMKKKEPAIVKATSSPVSFAGQLALGAAGIGALVSVGTLIAGEAALASPSDLTSSEYRDRQSLARLGVGGGLVVTVLAGITGGVLLGVGALE